jgi:quinolinate synthase
MSLVDEVLELKKKRNAVILAHNYQRPQVQDIADFVGDSYGLSVKASETDAEVIVFCGVDFMAETAAILNPGKTVLLPSQQALCPMAMLLTPNELLNVQNDYPDAETVLYINTHASVKALADCICTSSNAAKIVSQMETETVVFGPDVNLGYHVSKKVDKNLVYAPDHGFCPTHHQIEMVDVKKARKDHKDAVLVVHPECQPEVQESADFTGSTSQIIKYCVESKEKKFLIGTENGVIHRLEKEAPGKKFYPVSELSICPTMKTITLEKVRDALAEDKHKVVVPEDTASKARAGIERMLELTG